MEQKEYLYYSLLLGLGGLGLTAYGMFRQNKQSEVESRSTSEPVKSKRLLRPGDSFLLIGDSIGVGLQDHLAKLSHDYGSFFDSLVKTGTTVTYWNQHVDARDAGYDLILLSLGSNDVVGDPTKQSQAMNELIEKLTSRGAPVYWVLPPSFRIGHFKPKQQIFADMLADRGVFPLEVDGPQQSVASDPMHLHLTPQGYRTYAAQIFDAITRTSLGCQERVCCITIGCMPWALIRHTPIFGRKADCWMIRTEKLLTSRCADKISEADRKGWPPSQITIENVYEDRDNFPVKKVLEVAKSIQDFWWPAFLIVASLEVVYEFSKEKQEELGNFGKASGGPEFLEKAARKNLSEFVVVKQSTALVDVVEVHARDFAKAVSDLCDLQDKEILQIITDPDEKKGLQQALEWAESLEMAIQEQLDSGESWETALSLLKVKDRSLFRRADVC